VPEFALGNQGVVIQTLNDAWTFANIAFRSQLVPSTLKSPAQVLIALQMGMEIGLPPMAAIQNTAVINGRPVLWGDIMIALVRASGKFDEAAYEETWEGSGDTLKAVCTVRRLPNGKPIVREFSWAEAKTAGLASKDTYKNYPKRMLQNRARAFALRDGFSDVLKGVISAEEANDLPSEKNITPSPASTKPASLDELTETLSAGTVENIAEQVEPIAGEASEPLAGEQATADANDPLAAIKAQLGECVTVPDVTRLRNTLTGPASKITDLEKLSINQACDARAQEIRAARAAK